MSEIEKYLIGLPDNPSRQAYLKKYITDAVIVSNTLTYYLQTANINYLIGSEYNYMKGVLARENIIIGSGDYDELLPQVLNLNEKLIFLLDNLDELLEKYHYYSDLNHDPSDGIDIRIPFGAPEAVLTRCFEKLAEKKYTGPLKPEKLMLHFKCTDTTVPFDRKKCFADPIVWYESANKFVVLWNKLIEAGFIRGNPQIKYSQIGMHIVNNKNQSFIRLARTYNRVRNSLSEYRDIDELVKESVLLS